MEKNLQIFIGIGHCMGIYSFCYNSNLYEENLEGKKRNNTVCPIKSFPLFKNLVYYLKYNRCSLSHLILIYYHQY